MLRRQGPAQPRQNSDGKIQLNNEERRNRQKGRKRGAGIGWGKARGLYLCVSSTQTVLGMIHKSINCWTVMRAIGEGWVKKVSKSEMSARNGRKRYRKLPASPRRRNVSPRVHAFHVARQYMSQMNGCGEMFMYLDLTYFQNEFGAADI